MNKKEYLIISHFVIELKSIAVEAFLTDLDKLCEKYAKKEWHYKFKTENIQESK